MASKPRKPAERIKDFNSLAVYHEATAKEGDIDTPIFEDRPIRRIIFNGVPHFSVVDVVLVLAEKETYQDARNYWKGTRKRLVDEGANESVAKCNRLKLPAADGKFYETDCADIETMFRIVESIPGRKAEPIRQWLAKLGFERIQETAEPDKAIQRGIDTYRKMGRDDLWTNDRLKSISACNEKTEQWAERDVDGNLYAKISAEMSKKAFGITPEQHKEIKGLPANANRPDHMTRTELAIHTLADTAAVDIMIARDTRGFKDTRKASLDGAGVAGAARKALEKQTGKPVVSAQNFLPKPDGLGALP